MSGRDKIVAVVDGQGGGIGKAFIEKLREALPEVYILALGTNAVATSVMMKAGATDGATGENAIIFNAASADVIVGPAGIVMPNALLGEVSPAMASAIGASKALKVLIPSNRCSFQLAGMPDLPLSKYMESALALTFNALKD